MQLYSNNSRKSNVVAYCLGDDFIVVQFPHNAYDKYTYSSVGQSTIELMKRFAQNGTDLGIFISTKATQPNRSIKGSSFEAVL